MTGSTTFLRAFVRVTGGGFVGVFACALVTIALAALAAYVGYPWVCRRSARADEATAPLAGDAIVRRAATGCTLATSIAAPRADVWPWLAQIGHGRGGFYTHLWIERLLRRAPARVRNADRIVPELQSIAVGDRIRLTPDPYLGKPGQRLDVAEVEPRAALVLRQILPSGAMATWSFVLRDAPGGGTRLVFRRRGERASTFDRLMMPGYYLMDRGMLAGIKRRAERAATRAGSPRWRGAAA